MNAVYLHRMEVARMEKAALVEDYDGPVYCEGLPGGSYGDGYFADVDELADAVADLKNCGVEFAYCCKSYPVVVINLGKILEDATEEAFEDAIDHLNGRDELQAAVDAFNEANKAVLSWGVDYSRKVSVPPAPPTES